MKKSIIIHKELLNRATERMHDQCKGKCPTVLYVPPGERQLKKFVKKARSHLFLK